MRDTHLCNRPNSYSRTMCKRTVIDGQLHCWQHRKTRLMLKKKCWHTGSYRSHDQGCYEQREV